ncbi:glycosyltransferase family 39 protein [Desertivirga arenae]|uniref:glycosyltransferase family 39 protein n=1 Tax=Desertivirga arenae TaxID=2810309 RepID=UPI001A95998B|nr:glycosyltransferase family 39 protein [Pedobacter sp. SYSU D00823]
MEITAETSASTGQTTPKFLISGISPVNYTKIIYLFIALGIFFRLYHFFYNRSLWTDEMYLSLSFLKLSFIELALGPLEYQQKAPIGFLWLVKLSVMLFGEKEMALRLIPLLAGIASLFVYKKVAENFLKPAGVVAAVGMLAFAPNFVYHSVEIKQYGFELLVTILVLYLYTRFEHKKSLSKLFLWGIAGGGLVWFSYSSIFVLAGMALGITLSNVFRRRWKRALFLLLPFSIWMISFGLNFFLFTYDKTNSGWLINWFEIREGYIPVPPKSFSDISFLLQLPYKMLFYPLGLLWEFITIENNLLRVITRMGIIPLFFWVAGMLHYIKRNPKIFMILFFPVLLALVASAIKQYPFYERLTLFLSPLIIIFISKGFEHISHKFFKHSILQPLFLFLLLLGPLITSATQVTNTHLFGGYKRNYQRDCWLYINEHFQPGDAVYVYWNIRYGYLFYKNSYNLKYNAIIGNDHRKTSTNGEDYLDKLKVDLDKLKKYKRVWWIYEKDYWVDIGDYDGVPDWYFKNYPLMERVKLQFSTLGGESDHFDTKQAKVVLLKISK